MARNCPTCGQRWGTLTGSEMRRRRTKAGLTLRSMATRARLDFTYLSKVERGLLPPTRATEKAYRGLR